MGAQFPRGSCPLPSATGTLPLLFQPFRRCGKGSAFANSYRKSPMALKFQPSPLLPQFFEYLKT